MESNSNGSAQVQNAKDTIYSNAQYAAETVGNHPATQGVKDTLSSGPVAETVIGQKDKTASEFQNLAASRTPPSQAAATGQPLTHYHSFFYNLLSWENPRATALSFALIVGLIFSARYLPALRWSFKVLYLTLGATAALEVAGRVVLSQGLASSFRPKRYYTIPREALESSLEDVEQLLNFFVIEFQRVLFAENIAATVTAFTAALLSYWLIKFVPLWGLSLIGVSCIYLGPLIYINNRELIDDQLTNAQTIVNNQAGQVKDLAGYHTNRASSTVKQYAGDYTAKAQEYIGGARGRSASPEVGTKPAPSMIHVGEKPSYETTDFPHAPTQEPVPGVTSHEEQYEKSAFGGQAVPAS